MSTNEQNENLDKAKQFVNDAENNLKDFTKQTQDAIGNLSDKVKSYIDQKKNENEEPTKEGFFAHLKQQVSDAWEDTKDAAAPATTPLSDAISKDLKKRGFKFLGSTVIYSHLQATGVVDDHIESCFVRNN